MVTDTLTTALKSLGKPVSRLVYKGKAETYFTFQTVISQPSGYADDDSTHTLHTFRVGLFTKGDFTTLLSNTLTALKQAGFTISSVDAEIYENDTGFYHVPITIKVMEE
jgi:hypothetical protein